jgi:cytochrome P450
MRLKPVAPILLVEAVRETVVGGLTVPTGALLICLARPGAIDERHFPDPQTSRPPRWVVGPGTPEVAGSARRAAIPFGAGAKALPFSEYGGVSMIEQTRPIEPNQRQYSPSKLG